MPETKTPLCTEIASLICKPSTEKEKLPYFVFLNYIKDNPLECR